MKSRNVALAASLLAVGACTLQSQDQVAVLPGGVVAEADMPDHCRAQAALQFGVQAGEVGMSAVDRAGGIYTLQGRVPVEGPPTHTFQCQFDPERVFISIVPIRLRS